MSENILQNIIQKKIEKVDKLKKSLDLKTLDELISKGYTVRYYIPYGPDWYPYSIRRIRENPDIWKDTMKAFFFRSKHRK